MRWTPSTTDDRAATPVIAVVLGIAVTVALAAVVGTYAMNFGDETDATPQASVEFAEDGTDVTVTVQSVQRADRIEIAGDCGTATIDAEAGESATVTCSDPGDTVTVRATYQDHSALLVEYEYEG